MRTTSIALVALALACRAQSSDGAAQSGSTDSGGSSTTTDVGTTEATTATDSSGASSTEDTDEGSADGSTSGAPQSLCEVASEPVGLKVVLDGMESNLWVFEANDEPCAIANVTSVPGGWLLSLSCMPAEGPKAHELSVTGAELPDLTPLVGRDVVLDAWIFADNGGATSITLGDLDGKLVLASFDGLDLPQDYTNPDIYPIDWYDVTVALSQECRTPTESGHWRLALAFGADGDMLELIDGSAGTLARRLAVFLDQATSTTVGIDDGVTWSTVLVVALE